MASRIRIAIDTMSGDFGLRISLPAALQSLNFYSDIALTLVGDTSAISSQLDKADLDNPRLTLVHADDVVVMSDKPSHALRHKPQSSMRIALDLLQQGEVDAVVSAGNTGALMAIGCFVLGTLPGISRPAICAAMPTHNGCFHLLDLGATVDNSAEQLQQFAVMGSALVSAVTRVERPRVALLNIGEEQTKGNEQVKEADALLSQNTFVNYVGYVEGDGIFRGEADVVVCDGFVGNVALKVCEGTAHHITSVTKQEFSSGWLSKLQAFFAGPVLKRIYQKLDPQQYNGASLLGLQGIVVKSHGNSSVISFQQAISQARLEVEQDMLKSIEQYLASSLAD